MSSYLPLLIAGEEESGFCHHVSVYLTRGIITIIMIILVIIIIILLLVTLPMEMTRSSSSRNKARIKPALGGGGAELMGSVAMVSEIFKTLCELQCVSHHYLSHYIPPLFRQWSGNQVGQEG